MILDGNARVSAKFGGNCKHHASQLCIVALRTQSDPELKAQTACRGFVANLDLQCSQPSREEFNLGKLARD